MDQENAKVTLLFLHQCAARTVSISFYLLKRKNNYLHRVSNKLTSVVSTLPKCFQFEVFTQKLNPLWEPNNLNVSADICNNNPLLKGKFFLMCFVH